VRTKAKLQLAAALALAVTLLEAAPARADESGAYQLSYELDVPLITISGAVASGYLFIKEGAPPWCSPVCDKSNVNPFDRPFAGLYSRNWQRVGDVATISTMLAVPAMVIVGEPSLGGLGDLLVVGETALVTSAIQVPVSYAAGRPRPRVYGTEAPLSERNDANAARSFFSGHVANTLAVTLATSTALRRIGKPRFAAWVLGLGVAGSAVVGISRVAAGSHFPSDVLVGYAVGVGTGIAVPALHESKVGVAPLVGRETGGLAITGFF
jgi:membrane-associated phospholipid phosphatase